jgi:hypothetical protein
MVAALVVAAAAASTGWADVTAPRGRAVLEAGDAIVVDAKDAGRCLGDKGQYVTPSAAEVRRVEALLPAAIAAVARREPFPQSLAEPLLKHLATDRRFYVGRVVGQKRYVEVYGRCRDFASGPREKLRCPPEVDDGGDCVWQIRFDVERGTFDRFQTNGIA